MKLRILAIGDVVGESGTERIRRDLWEIRRELRADAVIVNGENSGAKGGIDRNSAEELFAGGADVITTGNHPAEAGEYMTFRGIKCWWYPFRARHSWKALSLPF